MEYDEAIKKFSQYYVDRNRLEFPTIFKTCDFRNKSVLEIGPAEGYFTKEASKIADYVTTTEVSPRLPFPDKYFDIVFSRWTIQNIEDLKREIIEMCRVAKENVMVVLPSEEGDETKLLEIKFSNKHKNRKKRIEDIKKWISKCGFKIKERKKLLKFVFPDLEEAVKIFSAIGFENKLSKRETVKLRKFLMNRQNKKGIALTQGASFICGYR
jgi:ubiquinone/menaquinone biosynthesis C-methylase UbiE